MVAALDERLDDPPRRVGREVGALVGREHSRQPQEIRDRLLGDGHRLDVDLRRGGAASPPAEASWEQPAPSEASEVTATDAANAAR